MSKLKHIYLQVRLHIPHFYSNLLIKPREKTFKEWRPSYNKTNLKSRNSYPKKLFSGARI